VPQLRDVARGYQTLSGFAANNVGNGRIATTFLLIGALGGGLVYRREWKSGLPPISTA